MTNTLIPSIIDEKYLYQISKNMIVSLENVYTHYHFPLLKILNR